MGSVVGIFPDHEAISKLTDALKSAGFDAANLTIITSDDPSDDLISTGADFVVSGEDEDSTLASGSAIITGSGGVDVPGMSTQTTPFEIHSSPALEALSELSVPDGRTDDFITAVDHGRTVAGYIAGDKADAIKAIFTAAGGSPVSVY